MKNREHLGEGEICFADTAIHRWTRSTSYSSVSTVSIINTIPPRSSNGFTGLKYRSSPEAVIVQSIQSPEPIIYVYLHHPYVDNQWRHLLITTHFLNKFSKLETLLEELETLREELKDQLMTLQQR